MNELYSEAGVKRRTTPGTVLLKVVLIFVAMFLLILTLMSHSPILLTITAILVVLILYYIPRLNIEYEYVFVDGQLDFDKIMGGAKRKTVLKIDFENVEIIAPQGSHALDSYKNYKEKNFTSLMPGVKPYVIVTSSGDERFKILFEPSEKMLETMKNKSPRKIVNY